MKISILAMMFSILLVSLSANVANAESIPEWVKNNADWWSQGLISDDDFVKGIQYLIVNGIMIV